MDHLKATVELSAKCNAVQFYEWEWREWDKFFMTYFKPYPGIRKIQHFRFAKASPGIVFTRTTCDAPESQFKLLKRGVKTDRFKIDKLPPVLIPLVLLLFEPSIFMKKSENLFTQSSGLCYAPAQLWTNFDQ